MSRASTLYQHCHKSACEGLYYALTQHNCERVTLTLAEAPSFSYYLCLKITAPCPSPLRLLFRVILDSAGVCAVWVRVVRKKGYDPLLISVRLLRFSLLLLRKHHYVLGRTRRGGKHFIQLSEKRVAHSNCTRGGSVTEIQSRSRRVVNLSFYKIVHCIYALLYRFPQRSSASAPPVFNGNAETEKQVLATFETYCFDTLHAHFMQVLFLTWRVFGWKSRPPPPASP